VLGLVDEVQIEFHDWQKKKRNKYSVKEKEKMHDTMEAAGLAYEYATFDRDMRRMVNIEGKGFPQKTGRKWPRGCSFAFEPLCYLVSNVLFAHLSCFVFSGMDAHYFRKDASWRLFPPCEKCENKTG